MYKSRHLLALTAFLLLLAAGCSTPTTKQDFHNYLREMSRYVPEENEMRRLNEEVMGDLQAGRTTSSQGMRTKLLPSMKRLIRVMDAVKPATQEVKEIQRINMATSKTLYNAFSLFADGLDKRDEKVLSKAMQQIKMGSEQALVMKSKRDQLISKYGVPPELQHAFESPATK